MGAAYFYHLSDSTLETTLPMLLTKARQAGWRIEVRGTTAARMAHLDQVLWQGDDDGFLPHGLAGGPHDGDQPILLTHDTAAPTQASCIMSVDQAEIRADEVLGADRVCIIFDGADMASLDHARGQWKRLTDEGCSAQYWAQDGGRWVKKAER